MYMHMRVSNKCNNGVHIHFSHYTQIDTSERVFVGKDEGKRKKNQFIIIWTDGQRTRSIRQKVISCNGA